jgi:hypothetical protein
LLVGEERLLTAKSWCLYNAPDPAEHSRLWFALS